VGYREVYDLGLDRIRSIGMEPYLDLGAETRSQNRLNRQHMDSFVFEMRLLDSQQANISTTLFGAKLRAPIVAAAICESRILKRLTPWDPPYLEQIAAGLADAGSMMSTGMVTLEELARSSTREPRSFTWSSRSRTTKRCCATLNALPSWGAWR